MGFFSSLFGGGKRSEAAAASPAAAQPVTAADLTPEVLAAISAGVGMTLQQVSAAVVAAVTATVIYARSEVPALRFKRTNNAWVTLGRQKIMDSRSL
jgi:hypothetical protein